MRSFIYETYNHCDLVVAWVLITMLIFFVVGIWCEYERFCRYADAGRKKDYRSPFYPDDL